MFKSLLSKVRVLCLLTACVLSSLAVTAQTRVTGRIIGADDKQGVVGAAVRIKGTTVGTVTDVNGNFSLSASPGQTLVVSYVGYVTKEVAVTGAPLNITLAVGNNSLNEIVVTGYTSQAKKDISGSVATVNIADAKQLSTVSSDQLLQGQAAGVNVVTQGTPGSAAQIYIRGINNFQNSQPLYIIDGVQTTDFKDVPANDIESIAVLKDAGATAIYGVAGGNGVIVITTKKGKGKSTITYDGYYGTTKPFSGNPFNLMSGSEFLSYLKIADPTNAQINPATGNFYQYGYQGPGTKGFADAGNPAISPSLYKFDPTNPANDYLIQQLNTTTGTDWYHAITRNAPIQSHSLSASGANDKNNYYTSFNYQNQQGTLLNSYYKRYSARVNTTFNVKDHVRFGENAQVDFTRRPEDFSNLDEGNSISFAYRQEPIVPVYDIAGNFGGTYDGLAQLGNSYNPVALRTKIANNYTKNWEAIASGFAEADFFSHFTLRSQYNVRFNNYYYLNLQTNPYDSGENHSNPTTLGEGAGYSSAYNWTNTLNYSQIFGKHNVKFLGGYEIKGNNNRAISGQGNSPFSNDIDYINLTNTQLANRLLNSGLQYYQSSTMSLFGRLDYQFNDRYILSGTIRRDGTSVFAPGHRFGTFPSVSAAWRVSQEDFMKGVSWINDLKLRGSYGTSGFAGNVGGANAFTLYSSGSGTSYYAIDGSLNSPTLGFYNNQLGNTNVTWETDKIGNGGFDATLFGNKLDVTAEYYVKTVSKLLFQIALPATVGGAAAPFVNVGSIRNNGFDVSATYHWRPTNDLSFDIGANVTTVHTKVLDLGTVGNFFTGGVRNGNVTYNQVGQPIGEFYGYKVVGYFASAADVAASPTQTGAAPGAFKYQDTNGDGKITDADRTNIGNPNPNFTYGLNLNAKYKGFDLFANFYGVQGNKVYNYTKYFTYFNIFPGNKNRDLLTNSWSPSNLNPKAPNPALSSTSFSLDQTINSFYVENGSFLKLRTLQIGYSFAPALLKRVAVDRLRIYVQGQNLFTATKYTGLDPEVQAISGNGNGIGIDRGNYPNNERRYIVGASFTF